MDLSPAAAEFRTGFFSRFFRRANIKAIALGPLGVSWQGLDEASACEPIDYDNLVPAEVTEGRLWGTVGLADVSGRRFRATGLTNRVAERVAAALAARVTLHASRDRLESLVAWAGSHADLVSGTRFISRWEHDRWMETWADSADWERTHRDEIGGALPLLAVMLRDPAHFWANHEFAMKQANDTFVRAEVAKHAALFDDVNGRSLTAPQREIAVRNDTDVLVIAGAGTGKTQAIAGKVAYLVKSGLARPEEILIVAFNTKAAEELQDRAGRAGGAGIQAKTFHSLGNRILGTPSLLDSAKDEGGMAALMQDLVEQLRRDPEYESTLAELILLYREPLTPTVSCADFKEYVRSVKASSLRAHKGGHRVKNSEELRIANWLFLHGIEYEYERLYPHAANARAQPITPSIVPPDSRPAAQPTTGPMPRASMRAGTQRPYKPTFFLPQWDLWLAHHALDTDGMLPAWFQDRVHCADEIVRARATHRDHGTRLVESYSWWFVESGWDLRLRSSLEEGGATVPDLDWSDALARLSGLETDILVDQALRWFYHSVSRYIQLLSEGGHDPGVVFADTERPPDARRIRLFKKVCEPAWKAYQQTKGERERIDFSDMIRLSRETLAAGKWHRRFTHIIVDEYQDVSRSKLELLTALRGLSPGSSLTCVGDDWQAINRFAGGDLGLMTGFETHVGGKPWETRLDTTFRFNQAVAEVSGWFVQNNPAQIPKTLSSKTAVDGGEVVSMHIPHASNDDIGPVMRALDEIEQRAASGATVCVLGRYRRLLGEGKETAASLGKRYPRLNISFSTVHKYKGKEADWVVVGWLTDDRLGFPCLRLDDPIMAELLPESERFPLAEERRLFYVALTRARRGVYLVCDLAKPSPFVTEIERAGIAKGRVKIITLGKAPNLPCPSCREGALVPRSGPHGLYYSCQNAPACKYREPSCSACGIGMMIIDGDVLTCSDEMCGHRERRCPRCGTGRLVRRQNAATGEWFLGCTRFADDAVKCRYTTAE
jgi:DNA helicase-4